MQARRAITIAGSLIVMAASGGGAAARISDSIATAEPGSRFRECRSCGEMTVIPAGSFMMGSPATEKDRFVTEGPEHSVTIARRFAVGTTDVTRGDYRRFVRATHHAAVPDCRVYDGKTLVRVKGKNWAMPNFHQTDHDPVVCVSWNDAHAFVDWLNGQVERRATNQSGPYRLPTEAEWEYAARAGTTTPYFWGSAIRRSDANYGPDEPVFAPKASGADRWEYTSLVKSFPANAFGLFDMAGNVWQFTEDCWHTDYVGAPTDGSARLEGGCAARVVRGGSWFKPPTGERSAKRGEGKSVDLEGSNEIGFRVVRDLEP